MSLSQEFFTHSTLIAQLPLTSIPPPSSPSIGNKNPPSWTMYFQVMTYEQAEASPFNPFDLTKVRTHGYARAHSTPTSSVPPVTYFFIEELPLQHHSAPLSYSPTNSPTQVWPHAAYPLHEIGRMVLDRNPKNYFAEIEQLAFAPSHMVPGINPHPMSPNGAELTSNPHQCNQHTRNYQQHRHRAFSGQDAPG